MPRRAWRTGTVSRVSDMPQQPIAGRYRLVRPLGQGGQGRVWLARDEMLRRDVAIKELVPPAGLAEAEQRDLRERSMREARTIARIDQANVVRIFDVLHSGGKPWIVMEFVAARPLHQVLRQEGPMTPGQAAQVGLSVLAALRAAHGVGVLHRDVKPANVLLAGDGRVVLTDFGLATAAEDPSLTQTGVVLGSPAFLAPERALDQPVGPASDLWSLGATLYAAVEGRSPYQRSSAIATLAALSTELPPPPERAGPLLPALEGLLRRDPRARIDAETAERLLREALTSEPGRPGSGVLPATGGPGGPGRGVLPATGETFSGAISQPAPVHSAGQAFSGATPGRAGPTPDSVPGELAPPDVAAPRRSRRLLAAASAVVALLAAGAGVVLLKPGLLDTDAEAAGQPPAPATSAQPSPGWHAGVRATPAGAAPASSQARPAAPPSVRPAKTTAAPKPARTRTAGPTAAPAATGEHLKNMGTGTCVDVPDGDPRTTAPLQVWSCHDGAGQRFTVPGDGTVRVLGKCLRIDGTADGSTLSIGPCTGGAGQQFDLNASYDLVSLQVIRCVEVPYGDPADGVLIRLIPCGGESHQKWSLG